MQQNSWGRDVQTDTVADIHFTFNTQDLWITRCGTIHVNCQTRIVTIYFYDHRCQNMSEAEIADYTDKMCQTFVNYLGECKLA